MIDKEIKMKRLILFIICIVSLENSTFARFGSVEDDDYELTSGRFSALPFFPSTKKILKR